MWYHGCVANYSTCSIGYATSPDGIGWTKHPGNPVLVGTAGEWDAGRVWWPRVIQNGAGYEMWYTSGGRIGFATSPDGISWTKHATNPVLSQGWGGSGVAGAVVILEDSTYRMWFHSQDAIGYAESTDGAVWNLHPGNPVLTPGAPPQGGDPVLHLQDGSDGTVLDGLTITGGGDQLAGGVRVQADNVSIRTCLIRDNYATGAPNSQRGGGVLGMGDHLLIVDSQIVGNEAGEGASGVRVYRGTLVMTNTLVAGNQKFWSLHLNGAARLTNVTIAGNEAGILFSSDEGGMLSITNSIITNNPGGIALQGDAVAQIAYSNIEGGRTGDGNIDTDPLFVDEDGGDYHLSAQSPCIDAGTNEGAPSHDFEGDPRPFDGDGNGIPVTDMGYDEALAERAYQLYLPVLLTTVGA